MKKAIATDVIAKYMLGKGEHLVIFKDTEILKYIHICN